MTSHRAYRRASSHKRALDVLRQEAGKQLDARRGRRLPRLLPRPAHGRVVGVRGRGAAALLRLARRPVAGHQRGRRRGRGGADRARLAAGSRHLRRLGGAAERHGPRRRRPAPAPDGRGRSAGRAASSAPPSWSAPCRGAPGPSPRASVPWPACRAALATPPAAHTPPATSTPDTPPAPEVQAPRPDAPRPRPRRRPSRPPRPARMVPRSCCRSSSSRRSMLPAVELPAVELPPLEVRLP